MTASILKNLKKIEIYLIIIMMFSCCDNPHIEIMRDLDKFKLKGRVKKIEKFAWRVKISYGEIVKEKSISIMDGEIYNFYDEGHFRELYFDKNGNRIKEIYLDENNIQQGNSEFIYDKYHREIKQIDDKKNTVETIYDDKNFKSNVYSKFLNNQWPWEGYNIKYYDRNSNIIKDDYYRHDKLTMRTIFEYNEGRKLVSQKIFGGGGSKDGELTTYELYGYDQSGNLVSIENGGLYKRLNRYSYNSYGNIIDIDVPTETFNNLIRQTYEYKYDNKGNWIERIEYRGIGEYKSPSILTIRKIEYY